MPRFSPAEPATQRSERAPHTARGLGLTYLLMLVGVLLWGGNWVAAKVAIVSVPPLTLAALRYAVALPLLFAWLSRQGPLPAVERQDWPRLAVIGVLYGVVSNLLFLFGLQLAPSVDGAILYPGTQPVFAWLLAALLLGEAVATRQALGLALALAGLVLVVGAGQLGGGGGQARLLGELMYLSGAVVWAFTNVLVRQVSRRLGAVAATTYSSAVALPLLALLSLLLEDGWRALPAALPLVWPALGYLALLSTGPPTIFFYNGIHRLGVARAAAFSYLVPVSGVVMTVVLLGEPLLLPQLLGGSLVLAGLWLVTRPVASASPRPRPIGQESHP